MINWLNNDSYLYGTTTNFKFTDKLACFDIDGTIIQTKSGKTFPINKSDWIFLFKNKTIDKLKEYVNNNYCIIFISNQAGLHTTAQTDDWMYKMNTIVESLNCPLIILASIVKDRFRKPMPSMFNFIIELMQKQHVVIDMNKSFYCGDASGRPHDHSDTDYKFALNCELTFYVPEEIFLAETCMTKSITYFDFDKYLLNAPINPTIEFTQNELIILCGFPASGKSSVANILVQLGYMRINQDTLKTKKKCLTLTQNYIQEGLSVVIDNLNYEVDVRKEYIDIANKYKYTIKSIVMSTSFELSYHNNMYRYWKNNNHNIVPSIVYNKYKSKYVKPSIKEGFGQIIDYHFTIPSNDPDYFLYFS